MPLVYLFLFFVSTQLLAQERPAYRAGQLLVQLESTTRLEAFLQENPDIRSLDTIIAEYAIYRLHYPETQNLAQSLKQLQEQKAVATAQYNHLIKPRIIPNDANFAQQWPLLNTGQLGGVIGADISAPDAWDLSTGGISPLGDTIVLCIIDDGINAQHPDLINNIWVNHGEIPNNGIDDDGNGYIDDYWGWNAYQNNDDLGDQGNGGGHGTPVAGLAGAEGNNGIGIAGVSWNSKLMIVVGGGDEAAALAAYNYPLRMRRLYNQTNGQSGAFVVATNASWGSDNLPASQAPLWCAIYDSLGHEGIISVGSTTNSNTNVDIQGDMPTSCGSPYLIAVTNSNNRDEKPSAAGFGSQSIDLAAPGAQSFSTANTGGYNSFGGTSAAAPHVAGALGLLYGANCPRLNLLARLDPRRAASLARSYILSGVDVLPAFSGLVATGGRLNLYQSLLEVFADSCSIDICYEPLRLQQNLLGSGDSLSISWFAVPQAQGYQLRYRHQDSLQWTNLYTSDTSIALGALEACTIYELQIQSDCDTSQSAYSTSAWFETANCCRAPRQVQLLDRGEDFLLFGWQALEANVDSLLLDYRIAGGNWQSLRLAADSQYRLENLLPCQSYEWQWASLCALNNNNDQSRIQEGRTLGCGFCLDAQHCQQQGLDDSYEWIARVALQGDSNTSIENTTGASGGYSAFVDSSQLILSLGQSYPIELELQWSGMQSTARWVVWIDFNRNGLFEDDGEIVFASTQSLSALQDSIRLPLMVCPDGPSRMRVAARYGFVSPDGCSNFNYGEVEDYCINLRGGLTNIQEFEQGQLSLYPNPSRGLFSLALPQNLQEEFQISLSNSLGQEVLRRSYQNPQGLQELQLQTELPAGIYFCSLQTKTGLWTARLQILP